MISSKSYSYKWAESIYNAFILSYGRATTIFKEMHGKTDYQLIHYVASDQQRWEKFKLITKRIQKWLNSHTFTENEKIPKLLLSSLYYALHMEFEFYDENGKFALDNGFYRPDNEIGRNHRQRADGLLS